MTGVLYVRVSGQWVPLGMHAASTYPAYAGPLITDATVARFGNMVGDQGHGFHITMDGYTDVAVGTAKSFAFWDTAKNGNFIGKFYRNAGNGALDVGPLTLGNHPVHTGFFGIWANGDTAASTYTLLRTGGGVYLNGPTSMYLRVANVPQINMYSTHVEYANFLRVTNSKNIGVGSHDPPSGYWGDAGLYTETGGVNVRIGLRANANAGQLRVYTGQDMITAVNANNDVHQSFGGLAYVNVSSATIKKDIRTLRPKRERIVVRRDPHSDIVEPPDIMALRPVIYRLKGEHTSVAEDKNLVVTDPDNLNSREFHRERLGLIAEDVRTVIPSAVVHDADGNALGIQYDQVTVALLDHVQRLTETIETLRYRISELERAQS